MTKKKKDPTVQGGVESDCANIDAVEYKGKYHTDQQDNVLGGVKNFPDIPPALDSRQKLPSDDTQSGGIQKPETPTLLEAAFGYADRGWAVLPLHSVKDGRCSCGKSDCRSPGKHPRTEHGAKNATKDQGRIKRWWAKCPDANIGIVTGEASGIIVLDIDGRNGGIESLAQLEQEHGSLPNTIKVKTGDGYHFYFKHPGGHIPCRSNILPGIDLKADGGYVVAPPSVHPNGRFYAWSLDTAAEFADAPDWLHVLIGADLKGKPLEHWHSVLTEQIRIGGRNTTLTSIAGKLFFHDVNAVLVHDILGCINEARCETPLSTAEVETIVLSVGKAHLQGCGP